MVVVLSPQAPENVLAEIARYLGNEWGESGRSRPSPSLEPPAPRLQVGAVEAQGVVYAGYLYTLPCEGLESYLQVLIHHTALSEGKGARLFRAYREERGRGYGIRGQLALTEKGVILGGFVQFGTLTPEERKTFTEILNTLCPAPLTPEETRRARASAERSKPIAIFMTAKKPRAVLAWRNSSVGATREKCACPTRCQIQKAPQSAAIKAMDALKEWAKGIIQSYGLGGCSGLPLSSRRFSPSRLMCL